ncbi:MAG: hypothetical protein DME33_01900 [Verrucomicrobia bacterium]|nr:MAG: hypothetical protein DME33_01900 [Verrucomicrobiota bacterium]
MDETGGEFSTQQVRRQVASWQQFVKGGALRRSIAWARGRSPLRQSIQADFGPANHSNAREIWQGDRAAMCRRGYRSAPSLPVKPFASICRARSATALQAGVIRGQPNFQYIAS